MNKVLAYFLKYSKEHQEIIAKFSRFPHRNRILGRSNTEEEEVYLKETGGSVFGVAV